MITSITLDPTMAAAIQASYTYTEGDSEIQLEYLYDLQPPECVHLDTPTYSFTVNGGDFIHYSEFISADQVAKTITIFAESVSSSLLNAKVALTVSASHI